MTNCERIRQMKPEELAKIIICPNEFGEEINCGHSDDCDCYECCLQWLNAEVEA